MKTELLSEEIRLRYPLLKNKLPLTNTSPRLELDTIFFTDCLRHFLDEDIGPGDVTTQIVVPHELQAQGQFIAKEDLVVCGMPIIHTVFQVLDSRVKLEVKVKEGQEATSGEVLAVVMGSAQSILSAERVALNLLQRLSGIATLTRSFVSLVQATGSAAILDTRKTTPGLRRLEKYAVTCGGGRNHRLGLFDAVLIKDNHIVACGGIRNALKRARAAGNLPIQIEVNSLEQLHVALDYDVEAVLLDNMSPEIISKAVAMVRQHPRNAECWLEASGGIKRENIADYARTGVNGISVGALTHSARSVDIALDFIPLDN